MSTEITKAPDEVLPELTRHQVWCCAKGCGPISPVMKEFAYQETFDANSGEVLSKVVGNVWVSPCCGAELMLWDESVPQGRHMGDFIEWKPTNLNQLP